MKYREGYKYQLAEDHWARTSLRPIGGATVSTDWITIFADGRLLIRKGYAWDGCSGPTWDDKTNMRAGLEHDAKYQLIRLCIVARTWRNTADTEFGKACREDGMMRVRAWYYEAAVKRFAQSATDIDAEPDVLEAP